MNSATQIGKVTRAVRSQDVSGDLAKAVVLEQTLPASIQTLWETITTPETIRKYYAPVSGDLREGGQYQIEGNASGTITSCDSPNSFAATWEYDGTTSWLEVRLTSVDETHTTIEVAHIARENDHWRRYGPGATGIGWDLSFLGLADYVQNQPESAEEAIAWMSSPDAVEFMRASGQSWVNADISGGEHETTAQERGAATIAFYTGEAPM